MSKGDSLLSNLAEWFRQAQRPLPWREKREIYAVWISEIMLQQTQVKTVLPYFERFMERFPSVEKLAESSEEELMRYWAGLGYYSRARNLHRAAQQIVVAGRFPANREEWLEVPGIGPYTAGAICSIALDQPEPLLDGNVERVWARVFAIRTRKADPKKTIFWKHSQWAVQRAHELQISPHVLNQSLMELGALICIPKKPACLLCPIRKSCRAFQAGKVNAYPSPKEKKKWIRVREEVLCFVNSKNQIWIEKQTDGAWRSGLWDFPKKEEVRTIQKKTASFQRLGELHSKHVVTRHKIERTTIVQRSRPSGKKALGRWVSAHQLDKTDKNNLPMGSAIRKTLPQVFELIQKAQVL